MKKPESLNELVDELRAEGVETRVEVLADAKAVIYLNQAAADADEGICLNPAECCLLFASTATVERLLEALDNPRHPSLVLCEVNVPDDIMDCLEHRFAAVDED
jgi:hypothetical protein